MVRDSDKVKKSCVFINSTKRNQTEKGTCVGKTNISEIVEKFPDNFWTILMCDGYLLQTPFKSIAW